MARFLLCAAVVLMAVCCCVGTNVSTACAVDHPDTLYRDFNSAGCGKDCDSLFCSCIGGDFTARNVTQNVVRACNVTSGREPSCDVMSACLRNRIVCLNLYAVGNGEETLPPATPTPADTPAPPATPTPAITAVPTEGPASGECKLKSNPLKVGLLAIAAGLNYEGSVVQSACKSILCTDYLQGLTSLYTKCGNTTLNVNDVCKADPVKPSTPAFSSQIRIGGAGIDNAYRADPAGVSRAIRSDLAKKLGLDFNFVDITNIAIGSLIVDFNVFAAAGVNVAALRAALAGLSANDLSTLARLTGLTLTVAITSTNTPLSIMHDDGGSACGDGCIAGIVIGSFAFVVIVIVGAVLAMKHFSRDKASEPSERVAPGQETV